MYVSVTSPSHRNPPPHDFLLAARGRRNVSVCSTNNSHMLKGRTPTPKQQSATRSDRSSLDMTNRSLRKKLKRDSVPEWQQRHATGECSRIDRRKRNDVTKTELRSANCWTQTSTSITTASTTELRVHTNRAFQLTVTEDYNIEPRSLLR